MVVRIFALKGRRSGINSSQSKNELFLASIPFYGMSPVKTRQRKRNTPMGSPASIIGLPKRRAPAEVLSQSHKEVAAQVPHGQAIHSVVESPTATPGKLNLP